MNSTIKNTFAGLATAVLTSLPFTDANTAGKLESFNDNNKIELLNTDPVKSKEGIGDDSKAASYKSNGIVAHVFFGIDHNSNSIEAINKNMEQIDQISRFLDQVITPVVPVTDMYHSFAMGKKGFFMMFKKQGELFHFDEDNNAATNDSEYIKLSDILNDQGNAIDPNFEDQIRGWARMVDIMNNDHKTTNSQGEGSGSKTTDTPSAGYLGMKP